MLSRARLRQRFRAACWNVEARVSREEFDALARLLLERTVATTLDVIRSADLTPERIAAVLLVGGSSRIPLVAGLLGRLWGSTVHNRPTETVVAEGSVRLASGASGSHKGPPQPPRAGCQSPFPVVLRSTRGLAKTRPRCWRASSARVPAATLPTAWPGRDAAHRQRAPQWTGQRASAPRSASRRHCSRPAAPPAVALGAGGRLDTGRGRLGRAGVAATARTCSATSGSGDPGNIEPEDGADGAAVPARPPGHAVPWLPNRAGRRSSTTVIGGPSSKARSHQRGPLFLPRRRFPCTWCAKSPACRAA